MYISSCIRLRLHCKLQAWIKRHFVYLRDLYPNFEVFLRMAIVHSRCDRFARAQYRHSAKGVYLEREQWERVRGRIQAFEQGEDLIWDVEDNGPEYDLQFNSM
jgi:hypothetical protein